MSMEVSGLRQLRDNLERLKDKAPEVMEEILIGEGVYAVGQARKIVTNAGVVNTGAIPVQLPHRNQNPAGLFCGEDARRQQTPPTGKDLDHRCLQ